MKQGIYDILVDLILTGQDSFYRLAYSYLDNREDALDAVQNAVSRALGHYAELRSEKAVKAGFRYLLVHMFGGNCLLIGIIFKVNGGDMLISNVTAVHDAAFWLILLGIAINAAIPPFHSWLTDAYPEANVTGSVFLSSFTTKVAVYCLIRMFAGTSFLIWFGVAMALYGALFAIMENDVRRLLSYHIISQVGFMVAGVGIGTPLALDGATAHAFSHILYKSLLFM